MKKQKSADGTVATNRKALYEYHIIETFEAGLVLKGAEVKSLREKNTSLDAAFARAENGEIYLHNLHINPYIYSTVDTPNPLRTRKLLLKKTEIKRLTGKTQIRGYALIPLEIYFKDGWAKVKLALAQGKKAPDKREAIKKRETDREARREFKDKYRG